jgi:hypothetical protein
VRGYPGDLVLAVGWLDGGVGDGELLGSPGIGILPGAAQRGRWAASRDGIVGQELEEGELAGGLPAGEREPGRGMGGGWLDGASHGAARSGEGGRETIAERPSAARLAARSPERVSAEAREGSDRNPRRAAARGDGGESPTAGVGDAGGHAAV